MKSTIKEAKSRDLLDQVENCCDTNLGKYIFEIKKLILFLILTDLRNLLILDLMNSLLVPTSKTCLKDKATNKKRIVKTSIADGRKAFLLQVQSMNDLFIRKFKFKLMIATKIINLYSR